MIAKLHQSGICDENKYPTAATPLLTSPIQDAIKYWNQILHGLLHNQQGCHNFNEDWRIQYII